jgi:membrane protein
MDPAEPGDTIESGSKAGDSEGEDRPQPQPERHEQTLDDPGLFDLSRRDYVAIVKRAGREALADNITDLAAALAYYTFLAIPAALLLVVGVFSLVAGRGAIDTLLDKLATVVPGETITLLNDSLTQVTENQSGGLVMIVVGSLLALWTASGAMNALMRGLNVAYDRKERRGFLRQRLTASAMFAYLLFAGLLTFGLLVLGPYLAEWIGDLADLEGLVSWVWWTAQWPILILTLMVAFAGLLYLGPDVDHPRWRFVTPGAVIAVVIWLAASGLFAVYVSMFGSYNKAWGSLAAVIVMLTWLWLSAFAILFGAEVNSEAERSRELRRGEPAESRILAPSKARDT